MDKIIVISVVRDFAMYEKCLAKNPQLEDAERVTFDNREQNEPIPVRYNRFLDEYDYSQPAWFVFCHEDFQPLDSLATALGKATCDSLWGPIGVSTTWRWGFDPHYHFQGRLEQCEKDGGKNCVYGEVSPLGTPVETFDCQCVIVHSSLVARHRLRFDPQFRFDLYVEDLCVTAKEKFGIASRILPFACRHWSNGVLGERYRAAERSFAEKWPNVCYTGTTSDILGGGANLYRRIMLRLKFAKRKLCASAVMVGMSWSMAGRVLSKAAQFGFSIVLARLLCPADFGLVGMIAIFMAISNVLLDGGLVAALVRKTDRTEEDYSTVFWSKLVSSVVIYAVLFISAPAVAGFYGIAKLTLIMRAVTLGLVLTAMASTFHARLQANCCFRELALVSVAAFVLSGFVGIAGAWFGLGVWAVVWQGLSWQVFTLVLLAASCRWLPTRSFSFASLRELFDFGWKHLLRGLLESVYGNCHALVIGKSFGAADLGLYNRADYYTGEAAQMIGGVVNEVNYPILAQLQNDPAQLRRSYAKLMRLIAGVTIPCMAVFAIFAEPIIRLIIGEQWIPCVPYLQVLAVGAALSPLVALTFIAMYVKGRTGLALKLELIIKPIGFALLIAAIPFGILAICIVKSATVLMALVLNGVVVGKMLRKGE